MVITTWVVIVFTGRYLRIRLGFSEGVIGWHNRAIAYALSLVAGEYPLFRLC